MTYEQIKQEDENKDLLNILPIEFKRKSKGLIKKQLLTYFEQTPKILNESGLYKNRTFTNKDIARFAMLRRDNYKLALEFWPKPYLTFRTDSEKERELEHYQNLVSQIYDMFLARQAVKNKQLVNSYDIEKDGYPSTGRGSLSYLFTPIIGNLPTDLKEGDQLLCTNKKGFETTLTIIEQRPEYEYIYKAKHNKIEIFITNHSLIQSSYSDLFPANKEIFAGWWNRNLTIKTITRK